MARDQEYIRARQQEGIDRRKAMGLYTGRVPIAVDKESFATEYKRWKEGKQTAKMTMAILGLKPNTFYRRIKAYEAEHKG